MTSSSRITHWFSVAAFSTIALVSIINNFPEGQDITDQEDYTKWVVSAMSIGLTFSALGVFANFLLKEKFEGQLLEGGLVSTLQYKHRSLSEVESRRSSRLLT